MSRDDDEAAAKALAAIHALPEAKALRSAALHYTSKRNKHGRGHPLTLDAEENLYRQMFALYPEAVKAMQALMGRKE